MANDEDAKVVKFQKEVEDVVEHYNKLIEKNGDASSIPIHLKRLEGQEVTDFSSQYGSENSFSYVASNLAGKTSLFPSYGDFINACVFRTYGPWWHQAPSAMKRYRGTPSNFVSVDFIELRFAKHVYIANLEIFETYNPGSIVKICARDQQEGTSVDYGRARWVTLWEGPPQPCMKPRIFSPLLKPTEFLTNMIRLEFNHDGQDYYTELDGVRLVGSVSLSEAKEAEAFMNRNKLADKPETKIEVKDSEEIKKEKPEAKIEVKDLEEITEEFSKLSTANGEEKQLSTSNGEETDALCYFPFLPEEIIQILLSYLDTRDLCKLSQTCRFLRDQCYDPLLFSDLNLQPFWAEVDDRTFTHLRSRCGNLKRLNVSWCGKGDEISPAKFVEFLWCCNFTLETLEMACCPFLTNELLFDAMEICINLRELNLESCTWIKDFSVFQKIPLKNLRRLNLYRTKIEDESMISLFRTSVDLEHLNIGSCCKLNTSINYVLNELGSCCRKLKTVDLWRMKNMDSEGFSFVFNNCPLLEEIDVGWCTFLKSDSNCFIKLANTCKNLKKLFLTANRTVKDKDLLALANGCPLLEQLDILGTRHVSLTTIMRLLEQCKNLKMLDVSFCVGITFSDVLTWRQMFPNVSIKKSFQNISEL